MVWGVPVEGICKWAFTSPEFRAAAEVLTLSSIITK